MWKRVQVSVSQRHITEEKKVKKSNKKQAVMALPVFSKVGLGNHGFMLNVYVVVLRRVSKINTAEVTN